MAEEIHVGRALISVSDKSGIIPLAKKLSASGVEILSTGGTAHLLKEKNIPVTEIANYTGFPEIMGGRVKTIHPKVLGGILGRRDVDAEIMDELAIKPIDLVVINLYPFAKTIADPKHCLADAIENIDIGGPNMIRAAAKNHQDVAVVVDSEDYEKIIDELSSQQTISEKTRFYLAKKAFAHTANYDATVANYLNAIGDNGEREIFPANITLQFDKKQDLRYGENAHQQAALYLDKHPAENTVASSIQCQGKALSFNNLVDADTALECVKTLGNEPACVIVKHANPCGVAIGNDLLNAYERAFTTDPVSAFGGIIALNNKVEADLAEKIIQQQFVEVIIAPEFSAAALEKFSAKANVRLLACGYWNKAAEGYDYKRLQGGLLIQEFDTQAISKASLQTVSKRQATDAELQDLLFAWKVAKFVKSNAIVYVKDNMTIGIGAGQMSRVYSARIAQIKAQDENLQIANSVMASDAFFPFRDSIDEAAKAGVTAIIQPGGSIRDKEVIEAADKAGIAMVFTGIRHFRH